MEPFDESNESGTTPSAATISARRATELLHRVMASLATVSSALEVSKVSEALKMNVATSHLTGQSGLLQLLSQMKMPESFQHERDLPLLINQLAEQTAVNLEAVISAAAVILSHSTADDVFTGACELSIELDPDKWTEEVNLEKKFTLRALRDKGPSKLFDEALSSLRGQIAAKSLPSRAEILFRRVQIQMHKDIAPGDPSYFRMSTLREADALRQKIVHSRWLPRIELARSAALMHFLHEAAMTAVRSVITAYKLATDWDYLINLNAAKNQKKTAAG